MTDYLIDTHTLIWWVDDDRRLGNRVADVIERGERVMVSDVSLWEISIKSSMGKLQLAPDPLAWFEQQLAANRFAGLPIARHHLARTATLPRHHRDPFDRLLVAQAQSERLMLVSDDAAFDAYDVDVIW